MKAYLLLGSVCTVLAQPAFAMEEAVNCEDNRKAAFSIYHSCLQLREKTESAIEQQIKAIRSRNEQTNIAASQRRNKLLQSPPLIMTYVVIPGDGRATGSVNVHELNKVMREVAEEAQAIKDNYQQKLIVAREEWLGAIRNSVAGSNMNLRDIKSAKAGKIFPDFDVSDDEIEILKTSAQTFLNLCFRADQNDYSDETHPYISTTQLEEAYGALQDKKNAFGIEMIGGIIASYDDATGASYAKFAQPWAEDLESLQNPCTEK